MPSEKHSRTAKTAKAKSPESQQEGLSFVVQKHAATRLHYDFRLELEGVLKSWAIPKGPTLDPTIKRLAMMVEDHPYEYKDFEGEIPKGNYGAGTVAIWDQGTYHSVESEDPKESEKILTAGLSKGDLKFILHGKKLHGEFALVKLKSAEDNSWLLIKKRDEFAAAGEIPPGDVAKTTRDAGAEGAAGSAKKGRKPATANQDSAAQERVKTILDKAPAAPMPHKIKPMLATLIKKPFDHPDWLFEIKHDGYRAIAEAHHGVVTVYSRNNLPFNDRFPSIVDSLSAIGREAIYDGEIVVVDETGRSSFQLLQNYNRTGKGNICFFVFDLLYLDGKDLRALPLLDRKELLQQIIPDLPEVRYSDHVFEQGKSFFQLAKENNLEGILGKLAGSRYLTGRRSRDWVKIKVKQQQEAIICGFTEPRGSRKFFGALVLGAYENGELIYIGHSGGGFDDATHKQVYDLLVPLVQDHSPFKKKTKVNMPVTWVKPVLVCEVSFTEWTDEGSMRMPIFKGMREDIDPSSVTKEVPAETGETADSYVPVNKATEKKLVLDNKKLKLTNLGKVFWPEERYTKGDLIEYYQNVSKYILPYLMDRPHSLFRSPHGIYGESFYQKEMGEYVPEWLTTKQIYSESNEKDVKYLVCKDEASLIYMANLGCIEINPWLSRVQNLDYPDYFVIDLDPEDISFDKVIEAALAVKAVFDGAGIPSFPKTSGATGIHIYVPLAAAYDYDTASAFAKIIATIAHNMTSDFTSIERSPSKRQKRVYLDYLQNKQGQTLAAPYSVRPRPGAPVSTPLRWDEVKPGLDPLKFTLKTVVPRLGRVGDLFHGVLGPGIDIERCIDRLEKA